MPDAGKGRVVSKVGHFTRTSFMETPYNYKCSKFITLAHQTKFTHDNHDFKTIKHDKHNINRWSVTQSKDLTTVTR